MKGSFISYIFNQADKFLCTGCGACSQVCHHKAINMREDVEGFLYPVLNENQCIRCGLCEKTCPVMAQVHFANDSGNQKFYVVTDRNKKDSKECATIGLCTMLSEWIIKRKGVAFGVILDEREWKSYHVHAYSLQDILCMRNSKYVQSDTKTTYSEVRELLKKNREVLYIGTPCQIAGLKSFLKKDYPTLFTIDLICHGCYSYKLLQEEVKYWSQLFNGKISNFRFRSKRKYFWTAGGIINFDLEKNGKTTHIERLAPSSPTYRCFAYSGDGKNYNLRQSCYSCVFRDKRRFGDLTVGDAWGLSGAYPQIFSSMKNRKYGISSVSSNTDKGFLLLDAIAERIILYEVQSDMFFCQPALLPTNREMPSERSLIYGNIATGVDYGNMIGDMFKVNLEDEHKRADIQYKISNIKCCMKFTIKKLWKRNK